MRFIYTKTFGIFSACVVIVALLVLMQVKGWLDPVKNLFLQFPRPVIYVVKGVTMPVKNFFSTVYQLRKIAQDNTTLNARVLQLQQDLVQQDQLKRENEALRMELGFSKSFKDQLVSCMVMSKNPFGLIDTLVLDCGTEKGVYEGQAVVSQGYLVGKVVYVGKDSSTVLLASNSGFSTDAKLSKTGTGAIVRGSFGSGLILDQLPQNDSVERGWIVVTAGIDSKIPRNILIGQVGDILTTSSELFKRTTLVSPINLEDLDFVFVIK